MFSSKKLFFYVVQILFLSLFSYQKKISKNYLKTRNIQEYNFIQSTENSLIENYYDMKDDLCSGSFILSVVPFVCVDEEKDSFNCGFLIDRVSKTYVFGSDIKNVSNKDVDGLWLGLEGDSNVFIKNRLSENIFGARIDLQIPLEKFIKNDIVKDFFIGIKTILERKERAVKLDLYGQNLYRDEPLIRNFFSNKVNNLKISSKAIDNVGFESLGITLGGIYSTEKRDFNIFYYTGVELPFQKTYKDFDIFYPYLGNDGHVAFLCGASAEFFSKINDSTGIGVIFKIEDHFYSYRTHKRVFDLYGKPWSKYMTAINSKNNIEEKLLSDISNLHVRIHPCNSIDGSVELEIKKMISDDSRGSFFIGYNIWASQNEYCELMDRNYKNEYQKFCLYGIKSFKDSDIGLTSSESSIDFIADNDGTDQANDNVYFSVNDLDQDSVCCDGGYSQSIFLKANILYEKIFADFGLWQEFGNNIMPNRFGGWVGIGVSW
jgi:hypothetical protein